MDETVRLYQHSEHVVTTISLMNLLRGTHVATEDCGGHFHCPLSPEDAMLRLTHTHIQHIRYYYYYYYYV